MFGDVAVSLLKMAGHSGTIPSALLADDIPAALARLNQALANAPEEKTKPHDRPDAEDADNPPPVGIRLRAFPLIQLLTAATAKKCDVMWEQGAPPV